ncbi:hypothetical protein [Bacillus sp. FJAT-49736]|uniref:hypothetical protein n=1 Tax=Bacillus sp. FJAT-49736 TaxID=2833582 RepID=UPI001BCA5C51|nr:hypothetical protein [Bacillus sp. FJAT-49736]MBS4172249.1 hypothetical protein [Bacillus sp. FJAT-49736]
MKEIVYDNHFNKNEWFILVSLCIGVIMIYLFPKRFCKQIAIIFFMCGVFFGFFSDHTLSVVPISFYDIGDTSDFEFMDLLSQINYGPYSYLFFYIYDRYRIKLKFSPIYILCCSWISVGLELLSDVFGVYHYQHGYNIYYSYAIYLIVFSIWTGLYHIVKMHGIKQVGLNTDMR